jgi:hypothetical protein
LPPVKIQRWTWRRFGLITVTVLGAVLTLSLVIDLLTAPL